MQKILKAVPIEDNPYADIKPIQEVCSTAYLAILKAIDEYLFSKGVSKTEFPRSIDGYNKALQKYLMVYDRKLIREFERLYDQLHIAGYYRGLLHNVDMVKDALKAAKAFIEKLK